ncbi:hypothetical protein TSUD_360000 [Trifolium subterraneum]|uniref:Peptidase S8/S53 domain-containing protein n=1 Tax=Trifolium subterraneum TaxID=3900 RepID=A0A2Z6NPT6_TRISU|nr:hypothetical protein TSUD_360000 [Trifolium subterraneum]
MAPHISQCSLFSYITLFHLIFITLAQSDNYIIHMNLSDMPKAFSTHHTWYHSTLSSVLENSQLTTTNNLNSQILSKLIYTYTHAMNGFSANSSPKEHESLKNSLGYISSIPDLPLKIDTTHSPQFLGLNPNKGAWHDSNFGKDVIIGFIDTGVWPESESFKDIGITNIPSKWKGQCENSIHFDSSLCNKKLIVPLYEDPVAIGTFAAMEKGVFVSTSAGNDGPDLTTLHKGTPWVITVAAGTMDRDFHGTLTLGNGFGVKAAPSVDSYSSRGPSYSCKFVLKPDITAPGTSILAAWPTNVPVFELNSHKFFSKFNMDSGTSMSCPHVAGVAALIKGAHRDWSPAAIRSAIMTTSDIFDNTNEQIKDIDSGDKATPFALGAGHVNPNRALNPGLVYDVGVQDYVNLLCALEYSQQNITTITRSSSNDCSKPSLDLNYPSFIAFC